MLPIHQAAHGALRELLRSAPMSPGKVQFAWNAAVGPAVQRATAIHLEGDVLLVDASTAQWARELSRSSAMIQRRLAALLGQDAVSRIVVRGADSPSCGRR